MSNLYVSALPSTPPTGGGRSTSSTPGNNSPLVEPPKRSWGWQLSPGAVASLARGDLVAPAFGRYTTPRGPSSSSRAASGGELLAFFQSRLNETASKVERVLRDTHDVHSHLEAQEDRLSTLNQHFKAGEESRSSAAPSTQALDWESRFEHIRQCIGHLHDRDRGRNTTYSSQLSLLEGRARQIVDQVKMVGTREEKQKELADALQSLMEEMMQLIDLAMRGDRVAGEVAGARRDLEALVHEISEFRLRLSSATSRNNQAEDGTLRSPLDQWATLTASIAARVGDAEAACLISELIEGVRQEFIGIVGELSGQVLQLSVHCRQTATSVATSRREAQSLREDFKVLSQHSRSGSPGGSGSPDQQALGSVLQDIKREVYGMKSILSSEGTEDELLNAKAPLSPVLGETFDRSDLERLVSLRFEPLDQSLRQLTVDFQEAEVLRCRDSRRIDSLAGEVKDEFTRTLDLAVKTIREDQAQSIAVSVERVRDDLQLLEVSPSALQESPQPQLDALRRSVEDLRSECAQLGAKCEQATLDARSGLEHLKADEAVCPRQHLAEKISELAKTLLQLAARCEKADEELQSTKRNVEALQDSFEVQSQALTEARSAAVSSSASPMQELHNSQSLAQELRLQLNQQSDTTRQELQTAHTVLAEDLRQQMYRQSDALHRELTDAVDAQLRSGSGAMQKEVADSFKQLRQELASASSSALDAGRAATGETAVTRQEMREVVESVLEELMQFSAQSMEEECARLSVSPPTVSPRISVHSPNPSDSSITGCLLVHRDSTNSTSSLFRRPDTPTKRVSFFDDALLRESLQNLEGEASKQIEDTLTLRSRLASSIDSTLVSGELARIIASVAGPTRSAAKPTYQETGKRTEDSARVLASLQIVQDGVDQLKAQITFETGERKRAIEDAKLALGTEMSSCLQKVETRMKEFQEEFHGSSTANGLKPSIPLDAGMSPQVSALDTREAISNNDEISKTLRLITEEVRSQLANHKAASVETSNSMKMKPALSELDFEKIESFKSEAVQAHGDLKKEVDRLAKTINSKWKAGEQMAIEMTNTRTFLTKDIDCLKHELVWQRDALHREIECDRQAYAEEFRQLSKALEDVRNALPNEIENCDKEQTSLALQEALHESASAKLECECLVESIEQITKSALLDPVSRDELKEAADSLREEFSARLTGFDAHAKDKDVAELASIPFVLPSGIAAVTAAVKEAINESMAATKDCEGLFDSMSILTSSDPKSPTQQSLSDVANSLKNELHSLPGLPTAMSNGDSCGFETGFHNEVKGLKSDVEELQRQAVLQAELAERLRPLQRDLEELQGSAIGRGEFTENLAPLRSSLAQLQELIDSIEGAGSRQTQFETLEAELQARIDKQLREASEKAEKAPKDSTDGVGSAAADAKFAKRECESLKRELQDRTPVSQTKALRRECEDIKSKLEQLEARQEQAPQQSVGEASKAALTASSEAKELADGLLTRILALESAASTKETDSAIAKQLSSLEERLEQELRTANKALEDRAQSLEDGKHGLSGQGDAAPITEQAFERQASIAESAEERFKELASNSDVLFEEITSLKEKVNLLETGLVDLEEKGMQPQQAVGSANTGATSVSQIEGLEDELTAMASLAEEVKQELSEKLDALDQRLSDEVVMLREGRCAEPSQNSVSSEPNQNIVTQIMELRRRLDEGAVGGSGVADIVEDSRLSDLAVQVSELTRRLDAGGTVAGRGDVSIDEAKVGELMEQVAQLADKIKEDEGQLEELASLCEEVRSIAEDRSGAAGNGIDERELRELSTMMEDLRSDLEKKIDDIRSRVQLVEDEARPQGGEIDFDTFVQAKTSQPRGDGSRTMASRAECLYESTMSMESQLSGQYGQTTAASPPPVIVVSQADDVMTHPKTPVHLPLEETRTSPAPAPVTPRQQPNSASASSPAQPSTPARSKEPEEFMVVIHKPDKKTALGMNMHGRDLLIEGIAESGLVQTWNRDNPSKAIKAGDKMVEVNGVHEPHLIIEQCKTMQQLRIRIQRKPSDVSSEASASQKSDRLGSSTAESQTKLRSSSTGSFTSPGARRARSRTKMNVDDFLGDE